LADVIPSDKVENVLERLGSEDSDFERGGGFRTKSSQRSSVPGARSASTRSPDDTELLTTILIMIAECPPPAEERNIDERRRYYRLTPKGRRVASEETERLASLVRFARQQGFASSR
jgi:hypothetical protein